MIEIFLFGVIFRVFTLRLKTKTAIKLLLVAGTTTTPAGPVHKHKLFLTDGWSCPFTGICIYIFRLNTAKPLPEEGFQKDL